MKIRYFSRKYKRYINKRPLKELESAILPAYTLQMLGVVSASSLHIVDDMLKDVSDDFNLKEEPVDSKEGYLISGFEPTTIEYDGSVEINYIKETIV